MKRLTTCAVLMITGSLAVAGSATAGAESCRQDSARTAECRTLATCYVVGAAIFNHSSAEEAVTFTRRCLAFDRRYRLATLSSGREDARERSRRLRAYESGFRGLYCEALRRANRTDRRICAQRRATSGRGGRTGGRGGGGTRTPSLTG